MRVVSVMFTLLFFAMVGTAQTPADPTTYKPEAPTLAQLMRGLLFNQSNVIFDAQSEDPMDPKLKVNSQYGGVYGGWQNIENAGLVLAESANLLMIPGRKCSNGKPAPITQADWPKFVQGLRDAGQASFVAARSKDMDKIVEVSGTLAEACANCHGVYRDVLDAADRCTPK